MSALTTKAATAEAVVIKGDLRQLSEGERLAYYRQVCESVGLNPLTQPFGYIEFQGKLRLYALRACTDQLRKIHGVSVTALKEEERDGVLSVQARVRDRDGREDEDLGCVVVANLKGEALANARMKAVTKAKRRATLSICGLGWLDESELDTIPDAHVIPPAHEEKAPPKPAAAPKPAPAPKAAQKVKLPKTGAELAERVKSRDEALAEAGVCQVGELQAAIDMWAEAEGLSQDPAAWTNDHIADAVAEVLRLEKQFHARQVEGASA
ncbi:MAG: hypothetical protein IT429_14950 [Gemmataceae bacterium]|nr:hypothetical protein [Gemmataceae bacterium]